MSPKPTVRRGLARRSRKKVAATIARVYVHVRVRITGRKFPGAIKNVKGLSLRIDGMTPEEVHDICRRALIEAARTAKAELEPPYVPVESSIFDD